MSLAGRARVKGSRVTVYRPTGTRENDGSGAVASWTVAATGVPAVIEAITDELVQKVFGASQVVKDRASIPDLTLALQPGDVLVVTSGPRSGQQYRIDEGLRRNDVRRNGHWDVPLISTTEDVA